MLIEQLDTVNRISRRNEPQSLTRRKFLLNSAMAASAFVIVPRQVVAGGGKTPPNERLNIAGIGAGGMGGNDIGIVAQDSGVNIVALCDVDEVRAAETFKKFPGARRFKDYRRMLDAMEREIDAVIVGTPDHTHAAASIVAMERGKHVYCEKPLAHSIWEIRRMMEVAAKHKIVTQLGNQGHATEHIRSFCEMIWDEAIGKVHTIHAGGKAVNSGLDHLDKVRIERPVVPATLDWDLWLGPVEKRPYHPAYLPAKWRGWTAFGDGTVGDWVCHVLDPVFWALDLGIPRTIQAEVRDYDFKKQGEAFPKGDIITFQFPAKEKRGPVTLKWYSGTEKIPRPPELEEGDDEVTTGAVVMGDKGTIVYGSHGASHARIIPDAKMLAYKRPPKSIPRIQGNHRQEWLDAIRAGKKAGGDFSYGGPLTEIAQLGIIAIKLAGTKLEWDAQRMRFTNSDEANALIKPSFRSGWGL